MKQTGLLGALFFLMILVLLRYFSSGFMLLELSKLTSKSYVCFLFEKLDKSVIRNLLNRKLGPCADHSNGALSISSAAFLMVRLASF